MTTTIAQKIAAWPQWKRLVWGWFFEAMGSCYRCGKGPNHVNHHGAVGSHDFAQDLQRATRIARIIDKTEAA